LARYPNVQRANGKLQERETNTNIPPNIQKPIISEVPIPKLFTNEMATDHQDLRKEAVAFWERITWRS
jgi:hypothetical protein